MSGTSKKLELRMYGLVPYNISPIQQGIQFGHAVVEYGLKYGKTEEYKKWAKKDKTFIILNGGTTNTNTVASMQGHLLALCAMNVPHARFHEPDLNDALTGIVFLVDERVFNKKKYPDYDPDFMVDYLEDGADYTKNDSFKKYLKSIGGKKNHELREFLKQFKLA